MPHQEFADVYAERFVKLCLNEEVPRIRTQFNDQVDLGWLRMMLAGILAYSEDARFWVYDVGKYAGRLLALRLKERGILAEFLQGQVKNSLGIFSMERISDDQFRIGVVENVFSSGLQNFGIRFDWFLAGVLASLVSEMTGQKMGAIELDCYANGASSCSFQVQPVGSAAPLAAKGESSNWDHAVNTIRAEYLFRSQMPKGRVKIRPTLGDNVDVALLRWLYGVVFTFSPEVRTWLYVMGKKSGTMMAEAQSKSFRGKLAGLIFVLMLMLRGRATVSDEEGSYTIERRAKNRFYFHIPQCPAHGEPDIGEAAGYLEAGFAAGMFGTFLSKPVGAKEIMCPSKGDPECVFELRSLE